MPQWKDGYYQNNTEALCAVCHEKWLNYFNN